MDTQQAAMLRQRMQSWKKTAAKNREMEIERRWKKCAPAH
jgi:hypothetical protein